MMRALDDADKTVPFFQICYLCHHKTGNRPTYGMNGQIVCTPCYAKVFWLRRLSELVKEPENVAAPDIRELRA
jgi:hypothetical protein